MTNEEAVVFLKGYLDSEIYTNRCNEAHQIAISALEKEIEKTPIVKNEFDIPYGREFYACPNCEEYIRYKYTYDEPTYPRRCKWCGQVLDWSVE